MLSKEYLDKHFSLNPPATLNQVKLVQSTVEMIFPSEYVDFLLLCNGLSSSGCLALHEIEVLPERNEVYEVEKYLPNYFMIGDDGGGQAILISGEGRIFEVGMGVMSINCLKISAKSIEDLLVRRLGLTLGER
ncbi:SMI1/KNR4 family protein [Burkholderia sp. Tr-20390]|uniref:SMI1/KNR4 family protein n=1 Tax=Burkholderia sp. Tr-20390 TaxID=2703904 RepID=UPI0019816C73|nr:SMI1/KNR4 family protein [Burkholderia sp. Tr-20390]MBN3729662.1 SMI1/KNR4 family protein [Burkholderia sp. Tr-20390]